jgi:hypothetical protein
MVTFHDNGNVILGWHGYFYSIVLRRLTTFPETGGSHHYYRDKYYILI